MNTYKCLFAFRNKLNETNKQFDSAIAHEFDAISHIYTAFVNVVMYKTIMLALTIDFKQLRSAREISANKPHYVSHAYTRSQLIL